MKLRARTRFALLISLLTLFVSVFQQEALAVSKKIKLYNCTAAPITICVDNTCRPDGHPTTINGGASRVYKLNLGDNPTIHVKDAAGNHLTDHPVGILSNPISTYKLYWKGSAFSTKKCGDD